MPKKYIGNLIHLIQAVINDPDNQNDIDDKFVACSSKKQLDELCGIFEKHKFQYTCTAMQQVLGIGIHYVKYDSKVANSGRLVFDHSRYIIDAYDDICTQVKEKYPKWNTSMVGIPMSDKEHKQSDPNPDQPTNVYHMTMSVMCMYN